VINEDDTIAVKVTWTEPLTYVPRETQVSMTVGQLLASNDKAALTKGKAIVAYAEALKAGTADALKAAADQVDAANPAGTDVELNEIASLLKLHPYFP
jgi:Ca-activated chloride channel family protein